MKLEQAIQILKDHNTWRRFDGISDAPIKSYPSMSAPRDLGIAIETVVWHFETKNIVNKCKACGIEIEDKPRYCDVCTCRSNEAYKKL